MIASQVHSHFKAFSGAFDGGAGVAALSAEVATWVNGANVAPKSIGIEYLEGQKQLLLSVGYRTDETPYKVSLTTANIGRVETLDATGLASLETRMAKAASGIANIICHELFVTETNDVTMIFLTFA